MLTIEIVASGRELTNLASSLFFFLIYEVCECFFVDQMLCLFSGAIVQPALVVVE